jgi:hypothetical protein
VPGVAPAVGWYPAARLVAGETAAIAALRGLTPGTAAILESATLDDAEKSAATALPADGTAVPGKLVSLGLNHLVAEVDAPAAGVVVVDEAYHPSWTATLDGAPAHIVPANGAFRGLLVGPGKHRIEMTFHAGLPGWIMLLSPLGMATALYLTRRRRGPRATSESLPAQS